MRRVLAMAWVGLAACAFPGVRYQATADGAVEVDGDVEPLDGNLPDGATTDTGIPDAMKPPLMDSGDPCDKDGDGYRDEACGGNDCDDMDKRAHPGVMGFQYFPSVAPTYGDWNCDHKVEAEITSFNINCASLLIATTNCATTAGYDNPGPACGAFASYVTCKNGLLTNCAIGSTVMKQQGCK